MASKTNIVLSNLHEALKKGNPFVFYRKSNTTSVYQLVQKEKSLLFLENYHQKGFVFAPFDNLKETIIFPFEKSTFSKYEYKAEIYPQNNIVPYISTSTKDNHIALVEKAINFITNHKTPKIVISRKEVLETTNFNIIDTFKALLDKYPTAFVYIWYHPQVGLWLGATPETLVQTKNNHFKTMALAGTQKFNGKLEVKWKEKEIKEHQFVTDYIVDKLEKIKIDCKVSETNTIQAGSLLHLHATITGRLKDKSQIENLIKTLHPTPAVCGLPKEKAKKFILKNENYDRAFYTGFLGELNFEFDKRQKTRNRRNIENHAYNFKEIQSNLFVNLRCMQIKNNTIFIYIGGGITKDSNPEKEYLETVAKAEVMKTVIQTK